MKKINFNLYTALTVFTLLSLILLITLSYCIPDGWFNFYDRFLIYGFAYIPIFITGLCLIHITWNLFKKKQKNILSWIIFALSLGYDIYALCTLFIFNYIGTIWFALPGLIAVLWLINQVVMTFAKRQR